MGITILCRDIQRSSSFYSVGLGLKVEYQSKMIVELVDRNGMRLTLQAAPSEAYCSSSYSPMLSYVVDSFDITKNRLIEYGGILDGREREDDDIITGCFRSIDGNMITVTQVKNAEDMSIVLDNNKVSSDGQKVNIDEKTEEIKNLLRSLKL